VTGFLLRRVAQAAVTLLVAVVLVFVAVRLLPGNPLLTRFGQHVDPAQLEKLRVEQGWDRPIIAQLFDFAWQVLTTGSLGDSLMRSNASVAAELRERVPATIELALAALLIAIPLGLAAGVLASVRRGGWLDRLLMSSSLLGVSVPVFFIGICLRALLPGMPAGFRLPLDLIDFESLTGIYTFDALIQGRWQVAYEALRHLCLPALALSTIPMSLIARVTRSSMLEVLKSDYLRTARAKGATPAAVLLRHALRNAAVPIVDMIGLQTGLLLSGAVLTETVFDWPGLGKYVVDALLTNDYVVVQAGGIVVATIFVTLNLVLDVLYLFLDPRLRR